MRVLRLTRNTLRRVSLGAAGGGAGGAAGRVGAAAARRPGPARGDPRLHLQRGGAESQAQHDGAGTRPRAGHDRECSAPQGDVGQSLFFC